MFSKSFPLAIGMVSVLGATVALAQNQKQNVSMLSLITAGYEIKNVVPLPVDAFKLLGWDPATYPPQVVITLQKGASTGVCVLSVVNWVNQEPSTLENANGLCVGYNVK
jgi:hypothetical protein